MRFHISCLAAAISSLSIGCAGDDKFATETDDEYTEPLTNAVIGTPSGVTTISPTGVSQVSEAAGPKAGAVIGGVAGTTGAGGAPGAGGKASTGGSFGGKASTGGSFGGKASTGGSFGGKASTGGSFGGRAATGSGGRASTGSTGGPSKGGFAGKGNTGGSGNNFGQWHFDDCSPTSHFLRDSSGLGANAQQELKADCVPGISGLGVNFRSAKDVVQIADQPQFTVDKHIGVAAWVNPRTVSGDQPIVLKREKNKTAFSLGVHNGNIEMSVVLSTGKTIISRAPIEANKWTHVAGMFDGTFVFLFINGQQFGQVFAAGSVREAFAPIRIGATTQNQFFNGIIDEVFVTTDAISSNVLTSQACITRPSTLSVSPATSGLVPPETSVHYDVFAKNNDVGNCQAKPYEFFNQNTPGFNTSPNFDFQSVLPGSTATFGVTVTSTDEAEPGTNQIPFVVQSFGGPPNFDFESLNGSFTYELAAPTGCFVRSRRELLITDVSVVDDPVRTAGSFNPSGGPFPGGFGGSTGIGGEFGEAGDSSGPVPIGGSLGSGGSVGTAGTPSKGGSPGASGSGGAGPVPPPQTAGVWSFGHLMRELSPSPEAAPAMTLKLLQHWLTDQNVNGFRVAARPAMQQQVIDVWPKTANGELDLDQSPLTLQAIVNRIDVRNLAEGSAGEGRMVYGVNGVNFRNFTVILEYNLVGHTQADVDDWAARWHALGSLPFPSEQYNAALEAITRRFTDRGASPGSPNGSALFELRTNEIALSFDWELRAFALSPTGQLVETTVKETPDLSFNNTPTFASFVNQNAANIIAEVPGGDLHTVPLVFGGRPFMAGSVLNQQVFWNGPGITDPEARFHASLNTCNGCHSFAETNTPNFTMITPRFPGSEAELSPFITGTTVKDPVSGQSRTLNDLGRRKTDLTALVCTEAKLATK